MNKKRLKIKDEINRNRLKKRNGNIVPARQRRKIASDKIDQGEKFPQAAKLVVSEFERRRQQRIGVSKLWLCKKMKCKAGQFYGVNRASSFKARKTYDDKGSKQQIWVSQPTSGLGKRQATLQLCIRGSRKQSVKPAIVFKGEGNLAMDEKLLYDNRIDVYFQQNAWMDCKTNREWTEGTLKPGITDKENENVLFADNVSFQTEKVFH
eukprot:gene4258-20453_t